MRNAIFLFVVLSGCLAWGPALEAAANDGPGSDAVEVNNPNPILVVNTPGFAGEHIRSLALSHDAQWLAAAGNKEIRIWHIPSRRMHAVLRGNRDPEGFPIGNIHEVAFSPDGRYLLVGIADNTPNGSTRVYKFSDLNRLHLLLPGHLGCTKKLAIASGGDRFATFGCGSVIVRVRDLDSAEDDDIHSCDLHAEPHSRRLLKVGKQTPAARNLFTFFDNDRKIAYCDDGEVAVLNTEGEPIDYSDWPESFRALISSSIPVQRPFGQRRFEPSLYRTVAKGNKFMTFVGGAARGTDRDEFAVALWEAGASSATAVYRHHKLLPVAVALCPGASDLAVSADQMGEIHFWRTRSGEAVGAPIIPLTSPIWGAALVDGSAEIAFADQSYSHPTYHVNRYGAMTRRFLTARKTIVSGAPLPDDSPTVAWESIDDGVGTFKWKSFPGKTETWNLIELRSGRNRPTLWDIEGVNEAPSALAIPPGKISANLQKTAFLIGTRAGSLVEGFPVEADYADRMKAARDRIALDGSMIVLQGSIKPRRKFVGHSGMITSIRFSEDGRFLVSASLDGTIRFYEYVPLKSGHALPGDLDIRRDGNRVVSPGDASSKAGIFAGDLLVEFDGKPYYERLKGIADGTYLAWDLVDVVVERKGERKTIRDVRLTPTPEIVAPSLTLLMLKNGDWIAWTPQGLYDCTSNAEGYIGWHLNQGRSQPAQFLPIGSFRSQLYRPGLIRDVLEGQSQFVEDYVSSEAADAADAAADLRDREEFEKRRPPRIVIENPVAGQKEKDRTFTARFQVIAPEGREETNVRVMLNGTPISLPPLRDDSTRKEGMVVTTYTQEVELDAGENEFRIRAANANGQIESDVVNIRYEPDRSVAPKKPRLFVLAIGVSEFKNSDLNLRFAHKDAEDFVDIWKSQTDLYSEVEVKLICNEKATRNGILDGLHWVTNKARSRNDVVFVFVAGHATFDASRRWHLLAHDYVDENSFHKATITQAELRDWFDNTISAQAILFIDTCHAAGAVRKRGVVDRLPNPWQGYGRLVLSGSMITEEAQESSVWKNGAFTAALLKAAGDVAADSNRHSDGYLSFAELSEYVTQEVRKMTRDQQTPNATVPGNLGVVNLLKLPAAAE